MPPSIATRKSQTRSISPSRCDATIDRDPELLAGPEDQLEHLVAAGRVEAVRRLVEEQQARVVDERLGELDPLLHPGRVAADRPVALLVQPDVAEDLGGPLASRGARQARHQREVRDDLRRRDVRGKAVVLGHVADELADVGALRPDVEVEDRRLAARRIDQAEQDLEQGALAGAVRADEADDPPVDVDREPVEGSDAARVALRQRPDRDQGHRRRVTEPEAEGPGRRPAAAGGPAPTISPVRNLPQRLLQGDAPVRVVVALLDDEGCRDRQAVGSRERA